MNSILAKIIQTTKGKCFCQTELYKICLQKQELSRNCLNYDKPKDMNMKWITEHTLCKTALINGYWAVLQLFIKKIQQNNHPRVIIILFHLKAFSFVNFNKIYALWVQLDTEQNMFDINFHDAPVNTENFQFENFDFSSKASKSWKWRHIATLNKKNWSHLI